MDATEARDHLQWIDGILRTADRTLQLPPATLIASGVLDGDAPAVLRAYAAAGLREHEHRTAGGWAVLVLRASRHQ